MSSLDTLYPINLSTPADVVLEPYTKVPGNVEVNLGFVPRAFKGGADFKIYTDSAGATQLTENTDYELTVTDAYYTGQAGFNVYISFKIINPTHYDKNLWITSKALGSYITAEYLARKNGKGIQRQAIVDGNFVSWQLNTSFTNPTNNTYVADMFVAKRSGSTADSAIFSQITTGLEIGNTSSLNIEITSVGTDAGTGLTGIEYRVFGYKQLLGENGILRLRGTIPSEEEVKLEVDYGTGTFSDTFTGTGAPQDFYISGALPSGATQIYLRVLIRDTAAGIIPAIGNYLFENIQFHIGETALPFFKRLPGEARGLVKHYYEILAPKTGAIARYRMVLYSANSFVFQGGCLPKRVDPSVSVLGVETTDWRVETMLAAGITPATLGTNGWKSGRWLINANIAAHGQTDANLKILDTGGIVIDARL